MKTKRYNIMANGTKFSNKRSKDGSFISLISATKALKKLGRLGYIVERDSGIIVYGNM